MYSGLADYSVIRDVKRAVSIPVIGNGDVVGAESALRLISESGCDGIMVGRGAVGRPFVFKEIECALRGVEYTEPSAEEKIDIALEQLAYSIEDKGEYTAVVEARKQLSEYVKGMPGAASLRAEINAAQTYDEMRKIFLNAKK